MSVVCCASTSWAQHKTTVPVSKLDSMQYLENVVVYAKKPYQEVIPAQTLSGKRLEGLNSHSVADAIRYFSGVQIKDYGGVGGVKTVDIRSMGTIDLIALCIQNPASGCHIPGTFCQISERCLWLAG